MHTLSSSEFRKQFASLDEDTYVTVNGHEIGMWVPVRKGAAIPAKQFTNGPQDRWTPEFRPVPKSGKK